MSQLGTFANPNILRVPAHKQRKSTIMVSLSNSNITPVDIQKLLEAGMDVAKLTVSHTSMSDKLRILGKLDKASGKCCTKYAVNAWPVGSCAVLKTCIVKTGQLEHDLDSLKIQEGSYLTLTNNVAEFSKCNQRQIFVDNPYLNAEVDVGSEITIGDNRLILRCVKNDNKHSIKCVVISGGELLNVETVCIRGVKHLAPTLCKMDMKIIRFTLQYEVDMIMVYYVRRAETLKDIKKFIGNKVKRPLLISGICTQEGLDNFDDIAKESDAMLLAREFYSLEIDSSIKFRLSAIQKWFGAKCQAIGKPYLLSGDVFQDSLITGDYSDREVSDLTNALLDGATGFVLKNFHEIEFAIDAIKSINELCISIEPYTEARNNFWRVIDEIKMPLNAAEACMVACGSAARQVGARVIVVPTVTGATARALLRVNPNSYVLTVSTRPAAMRLLNCCRSIVALMYTQAPLHDWQSNTEARVNFAIEFAVKRGWLVYGDFYVTLQRGSENSCYCDTVRVWTVTIFKKPLVECDSD